MCACATRVWCESDVATGASRFKKPEKAKGIRGGSQTRSAADCDVLSPQHLAGLPRPLSR